MCRTVFFTGTWKIVCCLCTLAHRGERIKKPPCLVIFKKKATLYICPSGVLLARNAITEMVSGFPLPSLKKFFLIMEVILDWGDDRHDVVLGRIKENSIC